MNSFAAVSEGGNHDIKVFGAQCWEESWGVLGRATTAVMYMQ